MSSLAVTCPAEIRALNHKKQTAAWWADPEYQARESVFLQKNPVCAYCGKPSTVAHHDKDWMYQSKEAYYDLDANGTAACGKCHWMYRRHFEICPVCRQHYMRRGAEKCSYCRGTVTLKQKRRGGGAYKYTRKDRHPCAFHIVGQRCTVRMICPHSSRKAEERCERFQRREIP